MPIVWASNVVCLKFDTGCETIEVDEALRALDEGWCKIHVQAS